MLTKAVNATADDDGWTTLGAIGNHLARSLPSWDPRTFGHSKLSSLVADQPYLETRPAGNHLEVGLKQTRQQPRTKAAAKKTAPKRPEEGRQEGLTAQAFAEYSWTKSVRRASWSGSVLGITP